MKLWNFKGRQYSITGALQLDLPGHAVIALTGAGGKTSLMFAWARELSDEGRRVVVSTSTHIGRPEIKPSTSAIRTVYAEPGYDLYEVCKRIDAALDECGLVVAAAPDPNNQVKLVSPPPEIMNHIYQTADAVIIEADGSRRRPFKWPAPWEPVVPGCADVTVCVAGLSSLGRSTSDVMYNFEAMPPGMRRDIVDEQMMFAVVSSLDGGRKGVQGEYRVFLNQADSDSGQASASEIQKMLSVCGIQSAWGSLLAEHSDCDRKNEKIAIILEAAGNSVRFGSNKLLHVMDDGQTMIEHALNTVKPLEVYKKIVVTQYDEVASLASGFDVVINDRSDLGISHSMQLGIKAAENADAYMFCVCDQPWLTSSTISKLIEAYKNGTAGIVSLSWQGEMSNPKIFSSCYKNDLLALSGDTGGRQIISSHIDDLKLVEADSENETRDIDNLP